MSHGPTQDSWLIHGTLITRPNHVKRNKDVEAPASSVFLYSCIYMYTHMYKYIYAYIYICIYMQNVVDVEASRRGERRRGKGERRMQRRGNKGHDVSCV